MRVLVEICVGKFRARRFARWRRDCRAREGSDNVNFGHYVTSGAAASRDECSASCSTALIGRSADDLADDTRGLALKLNYRRPTEGVINARTGAQRERVTRSPSPPPSPRFMSPQREREKESLRKKFPGPPAAEARFRVNPSIGR